MVICSKPDCKHIQKKDCDGYIGVFSERLFLTDKYELYVKRPGMEGEMSGNFNDVEVWRADLDGRNRKVKWKGIFCPLQCEREYFHVVNLE